MSIIKVYTGQLFQGNPATKGWTPIGAGPVSLTIEPTSAGKWTLVAHKEKEKVWESGALETGTIKSRLRENFVQLSLTTRAAAAATGNKETFGFRTKEHSQAQQFNKEIESIQSKPAPADDEKVLRIRLPSQEILVISFKLELTMVQVMKQVAAFRQLDYAAFALGLDLTNGSPQLVKSTATVKSLESTNLAVMRRKKSVYEKPKLESPTTLPIEVALPSGDKRSFSVVANILMPDLLMLICDSTGLSPECHTFDLPIQNLEKVKLQQLRLTELTLIAKESPAVAANAEKPSDVESTDSGRIDTSQRYSVKKKAPPPPSSPSFRRTTAPVIPSLPPSASPSSGRVPSSSSPSSGRVPTSSSPSVRRTTAPVVQSLHPSSSPSSKHQTLPISSSSPSSNKRTATAQSFTSYSPSSRRTIAPAAVTQSSSSPSKVRQTGSDINDVISSMLTQQAVGNTTPTGIHLGSLSKTQTPPNDEGKTKRVAPPPPKVTAGQSKGTEETDYMNAHLLNIQSHGIPLPSMVKRTVPVERNADTILQGTSHSISPAVGRRRSREKQPSLPLTAAKELSPQIKRRTGSVDSPRIRAAPPPPSSQQQQLPPVQGRKPSRKAPSRPQQQGNTGSPLSNRLTDDPAVSKEPEKPVPEPVEKPVPEPVEKPSDPNGPQKLKRTTTSGLVFKVPPPPPPKQKVPPTSETSTNEPVVHSIDIVKPINTTGEDIEQDKQKREIEEENHESEKDEREHSDTDDDSSDDTSLTGGYDIQENVDNVPPGHDTFSTSSDDEEKEREDELEEVDFDMPKTWQKSHKPTETSESSESSSSSESDSSSDDDEGAGDEIDTETGGVVLLEHKISTADAPVLDELPYIPAPPKVEETTDPAIEDAIRQLTHLKPADTTEQDSSTHLSRNMSSDFTELDNMVASLRTLIADTCEISGTDPTSPSSSDDKTTFDIAHLKTMAPPTDSQSSTSPASPPPPPPGPPPQAPPPPPPQAPPPPPLVKPTVAPKPAPPAIKPKPKPKPIAPTIDDELKLKLSQRQQKIDNVSNKDPSERREHTAPPTASTQEVVQANIEDASTILPSQPPTAGAATGTGDMQVQLQMLQQQMLQQQMMQLQQQFQQLQQQMMASGGQPGGAQFNPLQLMQLPTATATGYLPLAPPPPPTAAAAAAMAQQQYPMFPAMGGAPYPPTMMQPTGFPPQQPMGFPHQQVMGTHPVVLSPAGTTAAMGVSPFNQMGPLPGMDPTIAPPPATMDPTIAPPPAMTPPTHPVSFVQGEPPPVPLSAPPTLTPPPPAVPPPTSVPEELPPVTSAVVVDVQQNVLSEADRRSVALGNIASQFDVLMEEMKESDHKEMLTKPVAAEEGEENNSAYTGMTAALIEAMKERRQHFGSFGATEGKAATDEEANDTTTEWEEEDL